MPAEIDVAMTIVMGYIVQAWCKAWMLHQSSFYRFVVICVRRPGSISWTWTGESARQRRPVRQQLLIQVRPHLCIVKTSSSSVTLTLGLHANLSSRSQAATAASSSSAAAPRLSSTQAPTTPTPPAASAPATTAAPATPGTTTLVLSHTAGLDAQFWLFASSFILLINWTSVLTDYNPKVALCLPN